MILESIDSVHGPCPRKFVWNKGSSERSEFFIVILYRLVCSRVNKASDKSGIGV